MVHFDSSFYFMLQCREYVVADEVEECLKVKQTSKKI